MRIRRIGSTLLSGLCVYYVMAACSGGASSGTDMSGPTPSGPTATSPNKVPSPPPPPGPVPNAMADTWYASGTRLKLRYLEGDDGSKQFVRWYDSTRSENCAFQRHADGSTRCMPNEALAGLGADFTDAVCTSRVAVTTTGAAVPKYAVKNDGGGFRFYPVTGAVTTIPQGSR